jgi:hypothetical protein
MFTKIERLSVPPQTVVPISSIDHIGAASHAPVEVTVHARPVRSAPVPSLSPT